MPINKIKPSNRAKSAIAAAIASAAAAGWFGVSYTSETVLPPAVILATDTLILPWEGLVLKSHWDKYGKVWDICYGNTTVNGKPVKPGMIFTKAECLVIARKQIFNDYYLPLVKQIKGFKEMPVGVQAAMISGGYNFGVGSVAKREGMAGSTAARLHVQGKHPEGCEAQTAFNKSNGQILTGLVRRREMGDAQRLGEAEVCVSGLEK
jgi:GH24 family phage-related lysozyme (muramidase)